MESRDHSNGVSPKNHRSRGNFLLLIIALVTITFSMVSCGGEGVPNGTYSMVGDNDTFVFSGKNHYESYYGKGTYEIVKTDGGNKFIVFTQEEDAYVRRCSYSRVENKLRINERLYVKQ